MSALTVNAPIASETATARPILAPYCTGNGIDIGAGGDPIVPSAICIDRPEASTTRAHVGRHPTHLAGDAAHLVWFADNVLDYAYSSHCLEDFLDTRAILREWLRVLRPGGHIVLFLPDQPTYAACCAANGSLPNQAHKHAHFSLAYVKACLRDASPGARVMHELWPFRAGGKLLNPYSFSLVARKAV